MTSYWRSVVIMALSAGVVSEIFNLRSCAPFPGAQDRQKFNQLETVTTFTYRSSLVKVDTRNFELSWQQTHRQKTHNQTGPITIHCAAKLSAQYNEKSARKRRKHCALAVVRRNQKKISPAANPFPGARDGQNLNSWIWLLPLPIQTQFSEDRCRQFRVIVVRDPQTNIATNHQTDRTDYNTLRRSYI